MKGSAERSYAFLSAEGTGQVFICPFGSPDCFTNASPQFPAIPDKGADPLARAVHDCWSMRYAMPERVTMTSGTEFAGAFWNQFERLALPCPNLCVSPAVQRSGRTPHAYSVTCTAGFTAATTHNRAAPPLHLLPTTLLHHSCTQPAAPQGCVLITTFQFEVLACKCKCK